MEKLNITLAGNPNVGKSTLFNALTGMNQHTGNWTGKTVSTARGECHRNGIEMTLTDLPGTYSIMAHSAEEQVARDYICFGGDGGVMIVCDASCLERNLNLVYQILEITPHALVCVNLIDEAEKKKITVDTQALEDILHVPVCAVTARSEKGIDKLLARIPEMLEEHERCYVRYPEAVEKAAEILAEPLREILCGKLDERFAALCILEKFSDIVDTIDANTCNALSNALRDENSRIGAAYKNAAAALQSEGIDAAALRDIHITEIITAAEKTAEKCVKKENPDYYVRDMKIDRILTHRIWGIPVMLLILAAVIFITVKGANYPSQWLSGAFANLGSLIRQGLEAANAPKWLTGLLMDGIYCVLTWVTAVMLPPMAIFFPLFTLLEDVGYLPRAAFNLDRIFSRCGACGKQALTMTMGLGCSSVGVTGCRIIDSPRERLIAIITNSFMPCNGKFPTLLILISIFFAADAVKGSLMLTGLIVLAAAVTFAASAILSKTVLKGIPAAFALELPPYRRPQICKVIVRSIFDRTVFVLGRAVTAAAPAGIILWLLANINVGNDSLLIFISELLEPAGNFFGLDGVILLAFILGFPANEIILPIAIMIYLNHSTLSDNTSNAQIAQIFAENGWTAVTALCAVILMLFHLPCSTTCMTIKKETGSWKWTAVSMLLPLIIGLTLCAVISCISKAFFI